MQYSGRGLIVWAAMLATSARAAWVDGAQLMMRRVMKWVAEYGLARDGETVKSGFQTLTGGVPFDA